MKTSFAAAVGSLLLLSQPAFAAAPAPAAASGQAAGLADARAIIAIMFPPAEREAMVDKMQATLLGQMKPNLPAAVTADPGVKAIMDDFFKDALARQRVVILKHQPEQFEAMAQAYTRTFTPAEIKDILAFAQTPSGGKYLSKQPEIMGDPAVGKVNTVMFGEIHDVTAAATPAFKDKLIAYLKAHPEVAKKIADSDTSGDGE